MRNYRFQCGYKCYRLLACKNTKQNGLDFRTLTNNRNQAETGLTAQKFEYLSSTIPTQSQIVIAGAGSVANSVAYHLVLHGWKDVLILEQNW